MWEEIRLVRNYFFILFGIILFSSLASSAVTVNYPVIYAVQEQNGNFNITSTPVNGANVRAHYCLNVGCSLVDPNPFYTYSIPSGSNIAKVVYPTTLVGVGYRVYTYKNNYIGWEFFSNRSGNGEVTSSAIIYLSQKRTKSADILDFDYSNDSNCVEVSADIKSPVSDVRQSNVPLMEEASVLATFQVFKNGVSISNETDSLSIEYSTEEPVSFEYCGLTSGNYTFYLHSDITDQKIINPVRDTESFTLIIPQSCVPTTEVCDGQDNDCDGQVDEGNVCGVCTPGQTQACSTGLLGVCSAGTMTCNGLGQWGSCVQNTQSSTEVCDSLDNDCDGQVDEGNVCGCVDTQAPIISINSVQNMSNWTSSNFNWSWSVSDPGCAGLKQVNVSVKDSNGSIIQTFTNYLLNYLVSTNLIANHNYTLYVNATDNSNNLGKANSTLIMSNLVDVLTCQSYVYSNWSACNSSNISTRTIIGYLPNGCVGSPLIAPNLTMSCVYLSNGTDNDGDGYNNTVDCNDNNSSINPGAIEVCDGVDNDCDGLIDEGNVCGQDDEDEDDDKKTCRSCKNEDYEEIFLNEFSTDSISFDSGNSIKLNYNNLSEKDYSSNNKFSLFNESNFIVFVWVLLIIFIVVLIIVLLRLLA